MIEFSYKFRIYPNEKQKIIIKNTLGCCRFVFNYYLELRRKLYEENGIIFSYYDCSKDLTQLKKEKVWLKRVNATALQSSIKDLDNAYQNFFRRVKNNEKPGYPKLKSKYDTKQTYRCKMSIRVMDKHIQIPGLGKVKCQISRPVIGRILSATVMRTVTDKYFVSLNCRKNDFDDNVLFNKEIHIDINFLQKISKTYMDEVALNCDILARKRKKIDKEKQQLLRKTRNSRRYKNSCLKLSKSYDQFVNQRQDMMHKFTTALVKNYDVIYIEKEIFEINVIHYNKATINICWSEIYHQINYKAKWYGKQCIVKESK